MLSGFAIIPFLIILVILAGIVTGVVLLVKNHRRKQRNLAFAKRGEQVP